MNKLFKVLMLSLTLLLVFGTASTTEPVGKRVLLDTYYNHEVDPATDRVQHYTWDDTSKWGGYSQFGELFVKHGATLAMLNEAPTAANLLGRAW